MKSSVNIRKLSDQGVSLKESKSASDGDGLTVSEAAVGRNRRLTN